MSSFRDPVRYRPPAPAAQAWGTPATRDTLRRNLAGFERRAPSPATLKAAAVAIVVVHDPVRGADCFLLTRRSSRLRGHRAQYALPGGRLDAGETPRDAALRELREELGLSLGTESVLGVLDDYETRSGYRITPVVAWGGSADGLVPNPDEVARVFRIPLEELFHPDVPVIEHIPESERPVLSIPLASVGHRIYAPTAAMLFQFREVALAGRGTRVAGYDQPKFAWR